jgi:hypothetical protein
VRFYVKVADAACGIGWTRGYWTRRGAERAVADLRQEFAPAVWIYTAAERAAYHRRETS